MQKILKQESTRKFTLSVSESLAEQDALAFYHAHIDENRSLVDSPDRELFLLGQEWHDAIEVYRVEKRKRQYMRTERWRSTHLPRYDFSLSLEAASAYRDEAFACDFVDDDLLDAEFLEKYVKQMTAEALLDRLGEEGISTLYGADREVMNRVVEHMKSVGIIALHRDAFTFPVRIHMSLKDMKNFIHALSS